jgi:flagellar hook-length control protein FliK
MSDTGVKLLDAALANAGQTGAVPAGAVPAGAVPAGAVPAGVAPAPAMALPMPVAPAAAAAAAAATNTQALLTRASAGAEDKRAPGSAAIPSLSLTPNDGGNGAAGAAQLLANPTASTAATPAPVLKVAAAVDSAEFGQGVATQVSLMVDRNLNSASLQVNPPALGPIEVRIALQGGHAQVWFTSHSPVTRDALESSSSKLREMLGTQGFAQVSVDISQRSFQERSAQSQSYQAMPAERSAAGSGASAQVRSAGSIPRAASGLLDAYA